MSKKEKKRKLPIFTLLALFIICTLFMGIYIGKLGFGAGRGIGLGNGLATKASINTNPTLEATVKYSFYLTNNKIYFHNKVVTGKAFKKYLQQAVKEKEQIKIAYEEKNTSIAFFENIKVQIEKRNLPARYVIVSTKN